MAVEYSFGKTMHGLALVKFFRFKFLNIFERYVQIGHELPQFEVDILKDLGVMNEETIDIELEFTDDMSGKKVSATASTVIKTQTTELSVVASESFKIRESLKFEVVAKLYNGTPVSPQKFTIS